MSFVHAHALVHALEAANERSDHASHREALITKLGAVSVTLSPADIQFLAALHPSCHELAVLCADRQPAS